MMESDDIITPLSFLREDVMKEGVHGGVIIS